MLLLSCFALCRAVCAFSPLPDTSIVGGYGTVAELAPLDTVGVRPDYVEEYLGKTRRALAAVPSVLLRETNGTGKEPIDANAAAAQTIAVHDARLQKLFSDPVAHQPTRNEVFGIYPARASDIREAYREVFAKGGCFRVEMYSFATNATAVALVSLPEQRVFDAALLPNTQPDIPPQLKALALRIAADAPEVQKALGYKPSIVTDPADPNYNPATAALMADTKTALNRSRCERSRHLCVAPTYVKGEKALWAIVDLTDLRLVGIRWTNTGGTQSGTPNTAAPPTERTMTYEKLTECYCKTVTALDRNGWQLNYMLTSSDGLRISEVRYKGRLAVSSAKLVDWHVSYSSTEGFGYSDAVGCPYFSNATVLALEPPRVLTLYENGAKAGFTLEQSFHSEGWPLPCNYNYIQRYEFYDDGRLRIATASVGRGCGNDGTYRPVFRIALPANDNTLASWTDGTWHDWEREGWQVESPTTQHTPEGYEYRITDPDGTGYYIEPARGQFADKGRGDNAYLFATRAHTTEGDDEGDADLVTIGPCCNNDYRQGPEKFIEPNPEPLLHTSIVLWYVPQMKNDDTRGNEYCWAESYLRDGVTAVRTFPCFGGPMLVPTKR